MQRNQRGRHRENPRDDRGRERMPFRKPPPKRHRDPDGGVELQHRNRDKARGAPMQPSPEKVRANHHQDEGKWNLDAKRHEEWDKGGYAGDFRANNNFDSSDLRNQLLSKRRGAELEKRSKMVEVSVGVAEERPHRGWDHPAGNHRSVEIRPWYAVKDEGYEVKFEEGGCRDRVPPPEAGGRRERRRTRSEERMGGGYDRGPDKMGWDRGGGGVEEMYHAKDHHPKEVLPPPLPQDRLVVGRHKVPVLDGYGDVKEGQQQQTEEEGHFDPKYKFLCVTNLSPKISKEDLKYIFKKCGCVLYTEIFIERKTSKPSGCGIVEFLTPSEGYHACKKLQSSVQVGQNMHVHMFSETCFNDRCFVTSKYMEERYMLENLYGMSLNTLQSLGIQPPLVPHVYVSGLSSEVDQKKLEEVFSLAGKIKNCLISVRRFQDCTYLFGRVDYEHPLQAVQAISMLNKQVLCNREITVSMQFPKFNFPIAGQGIFPNKLPEGLEGIGARLELPMGRAAERASLEPRPGFSNPGVGRVPPPPLHGRNVLPVPPGMVDKGGRKRMHSPGDLEVVSKRQVIDLAHSQVDTIIVKNLPPKVTSIQLRDKFVPMGVVLETAVKPDGMGMVRFSTPQEARNAALLMEGNLWNDYILDVHLCT